MRAFARSVAWLLLPVLTGLVAVCPPAAAHWGRPSSSDFRPPGPRCSRFSEELEKYGRTLGRILPE